MMPSFTWRRRSASGRSSRIHSSRSTPTSGRPRSYWRQRRSREPASWWPPPEVYGKNEKESLSEDDSILGSTRITRWLYANTKTTDEFLALAYHRERGLPVVIVRFFNTVGPRQTGRYGMVGPRFVHQALTGEPLTIYGDGTQTRCFTDVRDSVRALSELSQLPQAVGEVFNIGTPREISIRALAELIVSMTGSRSKLEFVPYSEAYPAGFEDMRRRVPNVEKLRQHLGWVPSIPLEENLTRIIASVRCGPDAVTREEAPPPA
jgi:UDP-glucose 4-epimerase